ncbi:tail tube GTA-gp10-like protein [Novosphingobium kunmingense]|uniref:Tail tube GTA-gp10-like protein n=1 Tax=Novosphingobium kunmingense TaxID=1211806 RepID=A0A2N0H5N7_9SPHN|nr:gene transfer agent family protein [Novosphingobium kunmingense]PKB14236.1 tail tube GTA-gp10-like protein [Novosphingobium kunmingense]
MIAPPSANPHRGEAVLVVAGQPRLLRPSFSALVAAEEDLGPLFALVERAGAGQLRLVEIAALFWHCLAERGDLPRDAVGEAVLATGLAGASKPLRILLGQILQGAADPVPA